MAGKSASSYVLDLEGLHNFDDGVTTDFNSQLQTIVTDCRKRPGCDKSRTVTLKIEAFPSESDPDDVIVGMTVCSKIPAQKHLPKKARSTKNGQLQLSFEQDFYDPKAEE